MHTKIWINLCSLTQDGAFSREMWPVLNSYCEEAELFLNGISLGKKFTDRAARFMAVWQVRYQPGTLKAVGYNAGKQVSMSELTTAAAPGHIRLTADRNIVHADGQDLS